jgi:chromosome segregation ATPase
MAKGPKVTSSNSSDDELDDEIEIAKLIKKYGKSAATKMMKLIMKLDDLDETLESQEELLRLEREKSKTLERNLANEREENKKLIDSIKVKDGTLLEMKELLSSEKEMVDDLTRKFSFVNNTNTLLRKDNEKLQESIKGLQANHTALEVQFNTLWESSSKTRETSNSSSPSTSNGCARCYNIDIQTCATNHVEMNAMKKEITRLTQLLQEEVPSHMQVPKKNTSQRVGEFEKHTKEFGSKYMSKFGFRKVRDLIGMGKVLHKPFHLSRTTRLSPWVQMEV